MGEVRGRAVLVAGLGVSGVAAARGLARAGADVRAVESDDGPRATDRVRELAGEGIAARSGVDLGEGSLLDGVDLLVPSPGIAEASPLLSEAARRGTAVWSEPELAWRLSDGRTRLVVVTGTNGKTTTTELLGALLGAPTGGNIGTALTDLLTEGPAPELAVAELSSFQLRFTERLRAEVAVLLNVAPDHLDWHGSLAAYRSAKARAWANSRPSDWIVLGDDEGAREALAASPSEARLIEVRAGAPDSGQVGVEDGWITVALGETRTRVVRVEDMALRGRHNVGNACAAVAAAVAVGADPAALGKPLTGLSAGPHRLALVVERGGVRWIDDSKATNPHAAAAALDACGGERPGIVWIAGGLAKGLTFEVLEPAVRAHVRHAVTIGTSGPDVARLTRACGVPTTEAGELASAVKVAAGLAERGDTVLLAPACASMDQFRDYAERGAEFARLAGALDEAGGEVR